MHLEREVRPRKCVHDWSVMWKSLRSLGIWFGGARGAMSQGHRGTRARADAYTHVVAPAAHTLEREVRPRKRCAQFVSGVEVASISWNLVCE